MCTCTCIQKTAYKRTWAVSNQVKKKEQFAGKGVVVIATISDFNLLENLFNILWGWGKFLKFSNASYIIVINTLHDSSSLSSPTPLSLLSSGKLCPLTNG